MKILFPYSNHIAMLQPVEFKPGEVVKHAEPVLVPEYPWEGVLTYLYGSVIKTSKYRMWYQARGTYVAYARSRDGIRWEKPRFNVFVIEQPRVGRTVDCTETSGELCTSAARPLRVKSNVVLDLHMPSVIYDRQDRKRTYKLFGYSDRGYCAAFSKDGFHFRLAEENPVIPLLKFPAKKNRKTWFSDVAPVFKDSRTGKFVSHVKTYESDGEGNIRRCVGYSESDDFIHWSRPQTIWSPGAPEDRLARERGFQWADFYGLCGFNYGDGYLGLLWLFFIDYELEHGTHEGKIEVFLAGSPDGKHWKRLSDEALVPLSPSGWDSGMITTAGQPIFLRDSIRLYYGGANFGHGAGEGGTDYDQQSQRFNIGLATLRKDGFVYASASGGRLTTKPIESQHGVINVNADCTNGTILIDLIRGGRKLNSFAIAGGDAVDRKLRTRIKGDITLDITLNDAKLYSIEVL